VRRLKPDVVLVFYHLQAVLKYLADNWLLSNVPMLAWIAWEGSSTTDEALPILKRAGSQRVVHLSEFAQKLWKKVLPNAKIVPHGIDTQVFKPLSRDQKIKARKKWGRKLKSGGLRRATCLIVDLDRNDGRKRWDLVFDYVRRLRDKVDVHLIAHTTKKINDPRAYDLTHLMKLYDVADCVTLTDFSWTNGLKEKDVAELIGMCDIRLSMSMGEGFGVPTIEAMACGVPNVVSENTTMTELVGSEIPIPCRGVAAVRGVLWPIPDVVGMVEYTELIAGNAVMTKRLADEGRKRVQKKYTERAVIRQWCDRVLIASEQFDQQAEQVKIVEADDYERMIGLGLVTAWFAGDKDVLVVGSLTGKYVDLLRSQKLAAHGLEWVKEYFEKGSTQAKAFSVCRDLAKPWPDAELCVLWHTFERTEVEAEKWVHQAKRYTWVFVRYEGWTSWKNAGWNEDKVGETLTKVGMRRRFDLEQATCKVLECKDLSFEIWQNDDDMERGPTELKKWI